MPNKVTQEPKKENTENSKPMTKAEILQKIVADQQIIQQALQNGVPLKDLEKTHGFKFARLQTLLIDELT